MNARRFFVFGLSLLLLSFAAVAFAGGAYQRTTDGKTLVWNNDPKPNDAVAWSGGRDAAGYATGRGTLTWYTKQRVMVTGSNIAAPKDVVLAHYTGNMVHGKFNGPGMVVDAKGKTFHGTFVDGRQADDWVPGSAKVAAQRSIAEAPAEQPSTAAAPERESPIAATNRARPVEQPNEHLAAEPPAEGPPADEKQKSEEKAQPPSPEATASAANNSRTTKQTDDSLRALTAPPTSLHVTTGPQQAPAPTTAPSPPSGPRLTAGQVMDLADTEARKQGFDLGEYQLPKAQYNPADGTWSVVYLARDLRAAIEAGKQLNFVVDDKTKKAAIQSKK